MAGDQSPKPMRDRFNKGNAGISGRLNTSKRQWDTGVGAEVVNAASRRGSPSTAKQAAKFNNSGKKPSPIGSIGGQDNINVGRSVTAAPSYPGNVMGNGPKVKTPSTPKTPMQMGGTSGPDRTPAGMKDRFAGKTAQSLMRKKGRK